MLTITDRDGLLAALTDPTLDPELRALIGLRAWQIDTERDRPLSDYLEFVVVQPGDTTDAIADALGSPITPDHAEQAYFDWMEDHGSHYEFAFILTDAFGVLFIVPDDPDIEKSVRAMCVAHAGRLEAGR